MDTVALLIIEVLNGISSLALTCAGLAIIFGMMRVINFAHGEFMMLDWYRTVIFSKKIHTRNFYHQNRSLNPLESSTDQNPQCLTRGEKEIWGRGD